jgi:predicted ATP-grasp superfamily ATP-dependent carboligase
VRRAGGPVRGRGWYWQRRAPGLAVSALVVGNGRAARLVAIGRQLLAPTAGRPFRFGGTLAPAAISSAATASLTRAAMALAGHYRLKGLASIDALVDGDDATVLEINPRPGGSFDAYGAALGANLFAMHVAACRDGELPQRLEASRAAGSLIVHADRATVVPEAFAWPDWTADRSPAGTRICRGGPICTVTAGGERPEPLLALLTGRAERIRTTLRDAAEPCRWSARQYDLAAMTLYEATAT